MRIVRRALPTILCLLATTALAQRPTFDAVSIKQVVSSHILRTPNGVATISAEAKPCKYLRDRVLCQLTLDRLLEEAFQLRPYELAGPNWLASDWYSVQATLPLDTPPATARLMLQSALEETFNIQSHREKRETPVYEMVLAKHGLKLKPADNPAHRKPLDVSTPIGHGAAVHMASGQFSAIAITPEWLAIYLQSFGEVDRPIIDKTGLTGEYKVDIHWEPTENPDSSSKGDDPGFRDAIEQQLGLQLHKATAPIDILVLDHIDRTPSAN
jgi:uncharacterized protein (TIGR03435 family)